MPDATGPKPNGKAVAAVGPPPTGGELSGGRHAVFISPERKSSSSEPIETTKLYEYYSEQTGRYEIDVPFAVISKTLGDSLSGLREASASDDELQRENHVAVAWSRLFGLVSFLGMWPSFDEAFTLVVTAIESHRSTPYTSHELVPLQKVLEMLRRNPVPTDGEISLICETLEAAAFDLNAPLAGVELATEDGEE